MNHPPAYSWLLYAFGTAEWQMRLPNALSTVLLAFVLWIGLAPKLGHATAWSTGLISMFPPALAVYGQNSYEVCIAVIGIVMLLAYDRVLRGAPRRAASVATVIACAFVGPWFDWSFVVYCLGAIAMTWGRLPLGAGVRALSLPGAAALAGLLTIFAWQQWVLSADHLPKPPQVGVGELLERVWGESQGRTLGEWLAGFGRTLRVGFTWPLLAIAAVGVVPAFRRAPRWATVFALGLVHPLMFPSHSFDHMMFFVYALPLVALGAACAGELVARRMAPMARWVIIAIAAGVPAVTSVLQLARAESSFYKDLGRVLTAAVEDDYNVGHGWPYGAYLAYIDSVRVLPQPLRDATILAGAPAGSAPRGVRYLWLRFGEVSAAVSDTFAEPPGLAAILEPLPRTRVPELEVRIDVTGNGAVVEVSEAWLVTIAPPR